MVNIFNFYSKSKISFSISLGFVLGAYLFTTLPFLSTKNFVKFHFIASVPKTPFELSFKNLYDENIKEFFSYDIVDQTIDISKMIREILKEDDKKIVASKFINTVANIVFEISNLHKDLPIVLSGGVFQNKTLVEILLKRFQKINPKIYLGEKYSPNDESISLGQVYFQLEN